MIKRARKTIENKIVVNIQPSLISVTEDGTELHINLINKTSSNIDDIDVKIIIPENLSGSINNNPIDNTYHPDISKIKSGEIIPINIKILSNHPEFKGESSYIKIITNSKSQLFNDEKDVPVIS
jgi:hypothetical protein